MTPPRIVVSLGDPAGIGPEIVVSALARRPELQVSVYGDELILQRAAAALGLPAVARERIVPVTSLASGTVLPGRPGTESARAQLAYLQAAAAEVLAGRADAIVTAPISKEWISRAGFSFPGHTEYLASIARTKDFAMMLAGPVLRVTVATTHIALRDVPTALSVESLGDCIALTARALAHDFGLPSPAVAVAGLNPHAGEAGKFGDEETTLVVPALRLAREKLRAEGTSAELSGPHVPDVVFRQAAQGRYQGVVALYHDQGLIPLKLLHFDDAVNVTLGLPFVRTSPDHGTAYDIAGQGQANPSSFLAALDLAASIAERRRENKQERR